MKCILIIRRCISINYLHSFLRPVTAHRVGAVFPLLTVVIFHSGKKKNPTPKNLIPILSRKELPEDYKLHSHFKGFWANLDEIPDLNTLLWKGSIQQLTSLAPLCLWTWSLKNGSGGIQWRGSCLHSISLEMTLSRSVPNPCVHSFKLNFSGCGIFLRFLPWMGVDMLLNSCLALLRR